MTPEVDGMINATATRLMTQVFPALPPGYGQSSAGLTGMLLLFAAQQFENAADIRVWENGEMRKLLTRGANWSRPAEIAPAPSLKISALNAENHALKKALIALHAAVEDAKGEAARTFERDILAFLEAASDRRRLHLPTA